MTRPEPPTCAPPPATSAPPPAGRTSITGTHGVVASAHYLATGAGVRMLQTGGNAVDAAAAAGFCLALLEPHKNGLGGEVPVLIYSAREKKVYALSGLGWSPEAFTIGWCRENGIDLIPGDGYLPAVVPAMVGTWILALERFGTKTLGEVLAPAIEIAEQGFPVYESLRNELAKHADRYRTLYPSTAEIYLPGGRVPDIGELLPNRDAAAVLRKLARAEAGASGAGRGRSAGFEAARKLFYEGEIAERIVDFITRNPVEDASGRAHTGLLSLGDLAEWRARVEEPVSFSYRGLDVHKCSAWTQGPVFLQQLALLEGFDLAGMARPGEASASDERKRPPSGYWPASAEFVHTWIECAKLAFADREAYYGDPLHDDVPLEILLSRDYAARRRRLVGEDASHELRPGDVGRGVPDWATFDVRGDNRRGMGLRGNPGDEPGSCSRHAPETGAGAHTGDTTHVDVIDAEGNMVAATPSGGWITSSPVIGGLGFPLGTRGQMFYLNPARPNALAPRKRPRATLTPTLVTRGGEPFLAFGTPGGDAQDQWTLQFFLNHVDLGLELQAALDAPHFHLAHFPGSFYPRVAEPGVVVSDGRLPPDIAADLRRRGHRLRSGEYPGLRMMAVRTDRDRSTGRQTITGAVASTCGKGCAFGW